MFRSIRTTTALALVLTAAAPAAVLASDLRSPDAVDPAAQSTGSATTLRTPDARDAGERAVLGVDLRSADGRDGGFTPATSPPTTYPQPLQVPPSGFDWGDAGIGAAGGVAILTLLSGFGMLAMHRRRVQRATIVH